MHNATQNPTKQTQVKPNDTPAFFQQMVVTPNPLDRTSMMCVPVPGSGIPMRDYFAAKIATNLMHDGYDSTNENFPAIARDAYRLADAMIAARIQKEPARKLGDDEPGGPSQYHGDYLKPLSDGK